MNKFLSKYRLVLVYFPLLLLFGTIIRFIRLTYLPVFVDEAIYIRWSQIMAVESTLRFLPLSDGKQPLFMWAMIPFLKLISDPLVAGRILSVLSGLLTMTGIFVTALYVFKSQKAALIGAFIWTISPFAFFFDRLALVDSMLAAFGIWTFFLGIVTAKTKRLDMAILTGFMLGVASLTKSPALFFAILLPTTWLMSDFSRNGKKFLFQLFKLTGLLLVSYAIAFGMYNVLRLGPNFHLLALRNFDYVYPYSHILTSPLDPLKGHLGGIISYFVMLNPIALSVIAFMGAYLGMRANKKLTILILLWVLVPIFLIAEYSKTVTARYLLFILPFVVLLGSNIVYARVGLQKLLSALLFIFFMGHSIYINYKFVMNIGEAPLPQGERSGYLEEWTAGDGIREVSEIIKSEHNSNPEVQIVVGTEGYFGTLPNGLEMYLQGVPNVIVKGIGLGISKIPDSLIESKQAGNKTYLLINKSRLSVDPEKLGVELVALYPKVFRTPGTIEYNTKGPQEILYLFKI